MIFFFMAPVIISPYSPQRRLHQKPIHKIEQFQKRISESVCRYFGFLSLAIPLLDTRKLPFDDTRPENNTKNNGPHGHCYPGLSVPIVDIPGEGDRTKIYRETKPENEVNPTKNGIPIFGHFHSSLFSFLYSASFCSYSSLERPCHPLHIPFGDLPHPHLLMSFIPP